MSDLIDRQAAIDAARDWFKGLICGSFKGLEKRLRALPSARPNRGYWQKDPDRDGYGRYICSKCGEPFDVETCMGKPIWKHCPNCGARMEEVKQ